MSDVIQKLLTEVNDLRRRVGALETIETTLSTMNVGAVNGGTGTSLTISSGEITVIYTYHAVDTSGGGSEDLDTVNGGTHGDILILRAVNASRTVVCKDGTGNLNLAGDFSLDNTQDLIVLLHTGGAWTELSRSGNAA